MKIVSKILILAFIAALPGLASAQKYFTRSAKVYFDATSKGSPEQVDATSKSGTLVLDMATARIESAVLVKGFLFEKSLMQEHFNENYMESSTYPKATFKGKLDDPSKLNLSKDGTYKVGISGDMTIHGVTKPLSTTATFVVKGSKITASVDFMAKLSDYNIAIPSLVADKLGKEAKINVQAELEPMK